MAQKSKFNILLKRYRLEAGLSQEALAAQASLSTRAISDLERGLHRTPHPDTLEALAKALALAPQQRVIFLAAAHPQLQLGVESPRSVITPSVLPQPPTALIGREQLLLQAITLLRKEPGGCLTLTGPGGVGKTRLALEIAHSLSSQFSDGVFFLDLAPVRDAAFVPGLVAQALGLREQVGTSSVAQVREFLRDKQILLLLDNIEQIPDSASFVAELLAWCPHLHLLVTGRTPLHIRREQELPLAPLALKDAARLFCERAQAVRPGCRCAESEVETICQRLDCLPLALELAAVRIKIFALAELKKHLTNRLGLLRDGPRDLPARQQTMHDAIAWSYELLPATRQRCFRSLGVFAGGGTVAAAQAVCWQVGETTPTEAILILADLVEASLIQMDLRDGGEARFHLLELIGEFALERLRECREEEQCRTRHAAYYAQQAQQLVPFGPAHPVEEAHLTQDFANARAALEWAQARGEVALGMQIAAGFGRAWISHGQLSEAIIWYERMLALERQEMGQAQADIAAACGWRWEVVYDYSYALLTLGQLERAQSVAEEALQQAKQNEDHTGESYIYGILGRIAQVGGQLEQATSFFEQSDRQAELAGGASNPRVRGTALLHWADMASLRGDFRQAKLLYEQVLALAHRHGALWICASVNTHLGQLACKQHDYKQAQLHYQEALTLYRGFGNPTFTAWCLEGYAATLCAQGQYSSAIRLCGAASNLRAKAGTPLPRGEQEAFEATVTTARGGLASTLFKAEWSIGTRLSQFEAIDCALAHR